MSKPVDWIATSSGEVVLTFSRTNATPFAAAPFASGEPIVRKFDAWTGGLQDGNASGAPCVLLGVAHALNAGTIDARSGEAPFGRTCVADESCAVASTVPNAAASTTTPKTFLRLVIGLLPEGGM
jgi:hypothetical protein